MTYDNWKTTNPADAELGNTHDDDGRDAITPDTLEWEGKPISQHDRETLIEIVLYQHRLLIQSTANVAAAIEANATILDFNDELLATMRAGHA